MTMQAATAIQCGGCNQYKHVDLTAAINQAGDARCADCLTADARSGAMPDGVVMQVTGALIKALVGKAQAPPTPASNQQATGAGETKPCKVNDCPEVARGRFVLCYKHGQEAPICGTCLDGRKVGYNAETGEWFSACYQCNQRARAGAA